MKAVEVFLIIGSFFVGAFIGFGTVTAILHSLGWV